MAALCPQFSRYGELVEHMRRVRCDQAMDVQFVLHQVRLTIGNSYPYTCKQGEVGGSRGQFNINQRLIIKNLSFHSEHGGVIEINNTSKHGLIGMKGRR